MHRSTRVAAQLATAFALALVPGVILSLLPHTVAAQDVAAPTGRITGTVLGDARQPLPGATVNIPGTQIGAVAGDDGRYSIAVAPGTYQLRAQRIGYAPSVQQVTVTADQPATADFTLTALATTLSTQVVIGYTTQQRRDVSDAVAGVSGAELRDQQVATVEQALQGRIPGVQIASSGEPGRPAQVIIRGQNFVSANVSPLYVVDGMYTQLNPGLNPDDIESVEVLKDASAAAQYGAQAANGVIVIRTKHGQEGPNKLQVRSYYGYQDVPKKIDMMNATEWAAIERQAYENFCATRPPSENCTAPAGILNPGTTNTDWQDAVFTQGQIQDHNLTLSGGTPTATYLISGGFLDQRGALIATGFRRYNLRLNSELKRGKLTFGENLSLGRFKRRGLFTGSYPLIDVVRMFPNIPVYDPNNPGGYGFGSDANPTFGTNPVGLLEGREDDHTSNQVTGTAYAEAALPWHLRYRFNFGLNYDAFSAHSFTTGAQLRYRTPVLTGATLNDFRSNWTSLLYENLLTFDNSFGDGLHRLNAVAGYTEQTQDRDTLTAYRQGFTDEQLRQINAGGTSVVNNSGALVQSALRGYLLRANYALANRYLFTGSIRRDESSRFARNNRSADFSAASVGWVMSEEGFYNSIPLLSSGVNYFKLRASTGNLGNQDIGDYAFDALVATNQNYLFGPNGGLVASGATQLSLANPNIHWQSNRQSNVGLDLGLLQDRLSVTADYYVSKSSGLLVSAPVPWSLGSVANPVVNAGRVRNSGFEFGGTHRYENGTFRLNTNLNFTTTKNKVVSLGNGGQPIFDTTGVARTAVGSPIGEFYVLQTAGIFQSEAEVQQHTTTVNGTPVVIQPNAQPGDVRYVDRNHDGLINNDDRYNAGNGIPKLTGGLFVDGKWRQFDAGVNLRGSWGAKIFNVVRYQTDRLDDPSGLRAEYRPWTPENRSTTTPRAIFGPPGADNGRLLSDRWIESGNYVRIQNLVFGYTLPSSLGERAGLSGVAPRIYLNIQNLHTFTDYSNWDPEVLGYGTPLGRGIDDGYIYPNVRTVTFGLDFSL